MNQMEILELRNTVIKIKCSMNELSEEIVRKEKRISELEKRIEIIQITFSLNDRGKIHSKNKNKAKKQNLRTSETITIVSLESQTKRKRARLKQYSKK